MGLRIATILLICVASCVLAQYNDEGPTPPKKPLQIPGARRIKPQTGRLANPTSQTTIINQRFRRPIPIKSPPPHKHNTSKLSSNPTIAIFNPRSRPRPSAEPIPELPVFTSGIRGSRPSSVINVEQNDESLPIQSIQQPNLLHVQSHQEVKPVSEENEKDEDVVQVIANLGAVSNYGAQGNLLTPTAPSPTPTPTISAYLQERQQERQIQPIQYRPPQQISRTSIVPESQGIHQVIAPVQYRPQKPVRLQKPQQQQLVERNEYDINEARPIVKQRAQVAPKKSKPNGDYYEGRTKKPVAQVIRRYREETADGSIIWGFENDDGSFKEEIIGIDCITRGKYGYVDPDGQRREYTYETGIKCDEETQQQQDQDILNTFVDYQENKLVLPSGKTIDLSSMGKKQARRPQPIYRN